MKKIVVALLLAALALCPVAGSVEPFRMALADAIQSDKVARSLEKNFMGLFKKLADDDGTIQVPASGLSNAQKRDCCQVWGDCESGSGRSYPGARAVYWRDPDGGKYRLVAFLDDRQVYLVNRDLLPKVESDIDKALYQRVNAFVSQTPEPTADPAAQYPKLKKGDSGQGVRRLQQRLIQLGYMSDDADGSYGKATEKALKAFQSGNGLSPDGVASPAVQAALFGAGAISAFGNQFPAFDPDTYVSREPKPTRTPKPTQRPTASGGYVGNANTMKFHRANCGSVKQMKEENKRHLSSRAEAISQGYAPCRKCNP